MVIVLCVSDIWRSDIWRARANEAWAVAERMQNTDTRRMMIDIATAYDRLAQREEQKQLAVEEDPAH